MTDISCLLAGLVRIAIPIIALIIWRKKTGAKIYPAIVALLVCFPVFMLGGAIRSGFSYTVPFHYYLQQALLFGILEEGSKFLVLKFVLKSCDSRKDAVSYGIGHSAYEAFGGGIACLLLIGSTVSAQAGAKRWVRAWKFSAEGTENHSFALPLIATMRLARETASAT